PGRVNTLVASRLLRLASVGCWSSWVCGFVGVVVGRGPARTGRATSTRYPPLTVGGDDPSLSFVTLVPGRNDVREVEQGRGRRRRCGLRTGAHRSRRLLLARGQRLLGAPVGHRRRHPVAGVRRL